MVDRSSYRTGAERHRFRWKKPLALRAALIAVFLALTALSWLDISLARSILVILGVICFSVFLWKLGKQPRRSNTSVLLVFAVWFIALAVIVLFRLLVLKTHPWGSGPWREGVFACAAALPMGVCSAASYFRLRNNKRGRKTPKKG